MVEPGRNGEPDGDDLAQPHDQWVRSAVRRYERPLLLYAGHLTGSAERARDLVQEAFLRLCSQDPRRVGPKLAEWLYTVCRNLAIDRRRKERRMNTLSDLRGDLRPESAAPPSPEPPPPARAEQRDTLAQVLASLARLPPNQQEVIRLKFQQGMSYKQISDITSLSVTNVGFLIHTGLKTLRNRLSVEARAQ